MCEPKPSEPTRAGDFVDLVEARDAAEVRAILRETEAHRATPGTADEVIASLNDGRLRVFTVWPREVGLRLTESAASRQPLAHCALLADGHVTELFVRLRARAGGLLLLEQIEDTVGQLLADAFASPSTSDVVVSLDRADARLAWPLIRLGFRPDAVGALSNPDACVPLSMSRGRFVWLEPWCSARPKEVARCSS